MAFMMRSYRRRRISWVSGSAALMVIALCAIGMTAQTVDPTEKKILEYLDAHLGEAVTLIQRTVDIESPTENLAGVKAVGLELQRELESIGLTARWIDMPAAQKRAGHLIAETKG